MHEITPVGIIAENPAVSREFYRNVLKIQRVQLLNTDAAGEYGGGLLRLESPQIEVHCTETRISDRPGNALSLVSQRLKLWCKDIEQLKTSLIDHRTAFFENAGRLSLLDLNGINWDICPVTE
ncbi:MAG: hypothetical protein ACOYXC_00070 [Candidatus Rifleibacteriota bacterium]